MDKGLQNFITRLVAVIAWFAIIIIGMIFVNDPNSELKEQDLTIIGGIASVVLTIVWSSTKDNENKKIDKEV